MGSMIERPDLVEAFEMEQIRNSPPDFERNLRIAESLYELARMLGAIPLKDPLEGIEVDIRLAGALNARLSS